MQLLVQDLRFKHTFSSPGHPQGNPYAECLMRPLVEALYMYINQKQQTNWDLFTRPIQFAFNTQIHSMTGFSPFFLATGIQAHLLSDVLASVEQWLSLRDGDTLPFSEALAELYDLVHQRMQASAAKHKKAFDQNQLDVSFDIGPTVMVYSKEAHHCGDSTKFASHWVGPYTVTEMVTPVTY